MKKSHKINDIVVPLGANIRFRVKWFLGEDQEIEGIVVGEKQAQWKNSKNFRKYKKHYLIKVTNKAEDNISHTFAYDESLLKCWIDQSGKQEYIVNNLVVGDSYIWSHIFESSVVGPIEIIHDHELSEILRTIKGEVYGKG